MRQHRRNRPQGCLNLIALGLASVSVSVGLWACFGIAAGILPPYQPESVCEYEEGTDGYYELCMYGPWFEEDIIIQDEADTLTSDERNAQ